MTAQNSRSSEWARRKLGLPLDQRWTSARPSRDHPRTRRPPVLPSFTSSGTERRPTLSDERCARLPPGLNRLGKMAIVWVYGYSTYSR